MNDQLDIDEKRVFNPIPLAAWILLAVVIYVLSIGPVIFLAEQGIIPESIALTIIHTVYAPLVWFAGQSVWFALVINGYLDLWG